LKAFRRNERKQLRLPSNITSTLRCCLQRQNQGSGQYFFYDLAVNIGQSEVSAAIAIGEAFVVESEKMEKQ
jgi:hypothetical protein